MSQPSVQIVGLQRSGTRWLAMLVGNNYQVHAKKSNKHEMPGEAGFARVDVVLAIFKRFDLWLGSALRTPTTLPKTRPELYHDGLLIPSVAVNVYRDFYNAWAGFKSAPIYAVDYSELLRDSESVLAPIAEAHSWKRKSDEWVTDGPDKMPDWRREMYLET